MNFPTTPIGSLTNIRTGKLDANAAVTGGDYPFFTCARDPLAIDKFAYDCDAILIAGNGDLNVKHYKGKFEAYQRTYIVEVSVKSKLDSRYLYYFMSKYVEKLRELSIGGVIKYIKKGMLTEAKIPLPPLQKQKRIAAILDKADAIRQKRQQAIKLADDFLRATFLDMFGDPSINPKSWRMGTIRDLVSEAKYGTAKKASETKGKYPILRMNNITYRGHLDTKELKYVDLEEKERPKYLAQKGDLLFNRTNSKELVGKSAVYDLDRPLAVAGYLIRVRFNENSNNYYVWAFLNSKYGKAVLLNMCKNIVGMANINAQELQDIAIPMPSTKVKNDYAAIVEVVNKNKKNLLRAYDNSELLFYALTQRAFRGEL